MKAIFLILLIFLYSTMNGQLRDEKFYYFTFGCCFKNNSVVIKGTKQVYFNKHVFTNDLTGIDNENSFILPVGLSDKFLKLIMPEINKSLDIPLKKDTTNMYFYIYYYQDSLYYNCSIKPLKGG